MSLLFREKLAMLVPPSLFYRRLIAEEVCSGEPELVILAKLAPHGGTAVDIGANRGVFAYALADIADRVVAFEPNPDYDFFARRMLRGRAEIDEVALANLCGRGTFYVPLLAIGSLDLDYDSFAHPPESHTCERSGIRKGTQLLGRYRQLGLTSARR